MTPRLLFILKKSKGYGFYSYGGFGLYNSARFVVDMLNAAGLVAKLVIVNDNNDIDREVTGFRPNYVVIEALWVVPGKFDILQKLHPRVKWIVRVHSNLPFLSVEGIAVDWVYRYAEQANVQVAFNSKKIAEDFSVLLPKGKSLFLPNFYPVSKYRGKRSPAPKNIVRIGCFGAIRPMKNQLLQAVVAIRYAQKVGKLLEFNINASRVEHGEEVLKNIRSLFQHSGHKLIERGWLSHDEFLKILGTMDFSMNVSLSETFCIAAADAVSMNVPLICSSDVPWASQAFSVVPATDEDRILSRMLKFSTWLAERLNRHGLQSYSNASRKIWLQSFAA
jgi:hypothetical protein